MPDQYTHKTKKSYFSKIGHAFQNTIAGFLLFFIAIALIFINENNAIKRIKTLNLGEKEAFSTNPSLIKSELDGKLIHISGLATTREILTDQEFRVADSGIKLKRNVEMYQWMEKQEKEEENKVGGETEVTTTYSYYKGWNKNIVNSNNFKHPSEHQNPDTLPYKSKEYEAELVKIGEYILDQTLINKINKYEPLNLTEATDSTKMRRIDKPIRYYENQLYIGQDPTQPTIGDIRINYEIVKPTTITVIAKQNNDKLTTYQTKKSTIGLVSYGNKSIAEMFQIVENSNRLNTWILRIVSIIFIILSLNMISQPLKAIGNIIPIFSSIINYITKTASFILGIIIALIIIALTWITVRPLISLSLLAVISVLVVVNSKIKQNKTHK